MYGCGNNIKGCLSVSALRIGGGLSVSASNPTEGMSVAANRIGGRIILSASVLNEGLKVSVKPIGSKVIVACSLICTINKTPYLNVNPDYVWLTPDMLSSGEFDIISNVNWNIV